MPYQTLTLENLPIKCAVRIVAEATEDADILEVDTIKIKRRIHGTTPWTTIATITVGALSDFNFTMIDYGTKSKFSYDYVLVPILATVESVDVVTGTVVCDFDGLFIGTKTTQYVALGNIKCDPKKNTNTVTQSPFYSRYPKQITIGFANYFSGSAGGIFFPLENGCKIVLTNIRQHKDVVLEFLCDGTAKVLKMPDGRAYYVGTSNPVEPGNDIQDSAEINFEWVEIGAIPTDWVVAE